MAENDRELVQKVWISVKSMRLSYLHLSKCPNAIWTHRCPMLGIVVVVVVAVVIPFVIDVFPGFRCGYASL